MSGGHRARKRFGQHFLSAPDVVNDIVTAINADGGDTLVEIGPGRGAITRPLADSGATLHAIEFDRDLVPRLRAQFADRPNVTIHEADALAFDYASLGDSLRIVGNLPYNISTPLLFALIGCKGQLHDLHLMLQKEVVERMSARPGSKAYGRLSIMLACHLEVAPLFDVGPESFSPPPKVKSTVVELRPLPPGTYDIKDNKGFAWARVWPKVATVLRAPRVRW
jgi:16S rRNA (adenine1518-N6/adenine1519-N6)-dimethyltransferase